MRLKPHNRLGVCVFVHTRVCVWVLESGRVLVGEGGGQKKKGSDSVRRQFILKASPLIDLWPFVNREACKP